MAMEFLAPKKAGIDLGTANILVYVKGQGIVVNEPSVVARHNRDNAIVAVGNEARAMQGRTPGSISVIRPMRDGVIADYLTTEAMLRYFIGIITGRFNLIRPEVMVTVPAGVTSVEQRAVRDASEQAGARKPAHLVPEPLAAAIGARIPIGTARGNMVVNIGGGRTEAAVISLYGIVVSESVRMAGDRIDEAIVAYVRRRHNLIIGDRTAEEIKIAIGSALPVDEGLATQVRGRDQLSGLPKTISLTSNEVAQSIQDCLGTIVQTVRAVLEKTPPELAADVIDRGIVLTGGGALLRHMDELLTQETGVPCYVADNPLECVAIGAGIALDHLDVIKRSLPTEEENLVGLFPSPDQR
ncbi:MAG: rod shape-determining protein [Dehalococcoidia bacterium]|jgi:rod shape-determining protein MreB|nr:rod shape-determining protein [Dehalococcoidia bacterium]